jgi:hypothetical protein
MKLKLLPSEVLLMIGERSGTSDLLSLRFVDSEFHKLLNHRSLWLNRTKLCGIYRPCFESLELEGIRAHLREHMKAVYQQIRSIFSKECAQLLASIMIDDNASDLEANLESSDTHSATELLPIAIEFGRFRIMHSLFTHFKLPCKLKWLLMAIRFDSYPAVKYLVEVQRLPLMTDEPYQLFPTVQGGWDPHFVMLKESGHRSRARFLHYNDLILGEIIRCQHPQIVGYLRQKLEELQQNEGVNHPNQYLYSKLKHHSLTDINVIERCDSPDLEALEFHGPSY